jgi:hypothetical protein
MPKQTTAEYHFEGVQSAQCTDDGQVIILNTIGPDGTCSLAVPAKAVPHVCLMLLAANADARRRTSDRAIQASEIRAMEVLPHPQSEKAILAITIHSGAAPVGFCLDEKMLVNFARGILERRGLLIPNRPPTVQ